jgi:hypothetical protein
MFGSTSAVSSVAAIEISSTTKGILLPRMTAAQRDAISAVEGLSIYNTDTKRLDTYNGTTWTPSVISPSQLTADQDDYNPTGWAAATVVRLDGDSGMRAITSMAAGHSGEIKTLVNVGSYPIYFPGEHPDGTAANRISTEKDIFLYPKKSLQIYYDGTSTRWRILTPDADVKDGRSVYYSWSAGSTTVGDYGDVGFLAISSGTASGAGTATSTSPGYLILSTAATTNGGGAVYFTKNSQTFGSFSSSHGYADFVLNIPTLSDGTNTFETNIQITTSPLSTSLTPNNTIGIRYTDSVNSGKFQAFCKDNAGSESTGVDLGVTVTAGQIYKIRIEVDKAKTEARFYIDSVFAGRVTTNMPNDGAFGARVVILKSAGATERTTRVHSMSAGAIYP